MWFLINGIISFGLDIQNPTAYNEMNNRKRMIQNDAFRKEG